MPGKSKKREKHPLQVAWPNDPAWRPFGDRLDFLSPERQHLALQGRMKILPAKNPEKREPFTSDREVTVT